MSAKKGKSAAQNVVSTVKKYGVPFYCADVDLEQDNEALKACAEAVATGLKEQGVILFSAGLDNLIIASVVPESKKDLVDGLEWIKVAVKGLEGAVVTGDSVAAFAEFKCDKEQNQFPIKLLDVAKGQALAHLRAKGQVQDSSEDDEPGFQFDD